MLIIASNSILETGLYHLLYWHKEVVSGAVVKNNLDFLVLLQFEYSSFVAIWVFEFCHNLSCEFCHNLSCKFCHNFSFWILSHLKCLCLVSVSVFEFCHNLSFRVLSQLEFLSFVTIRVFRFFFTIWVFQFCHNFFYHLSCWSVKLFLLKICHYYFWPYWYCRYCHCHYCHCRYSHYYYCHCLYSHYYYCHCRYCHYYYCHCH